MNSSKKEKMIKKLSQTYSIGEKVKICISILAVANVFLVWWYSELERRLLVVQLGINKSLFEGSSKETDINFNEMENFEPKIASTLQ